MDNKGDIVQNVENRPYSGLTAAILDFKVTVTSEVHENHFNGLLMVLLLKNDTSLMFTASQYPEILQFMYFKMAAGGHFEFLRK